MRNRKLKGRPNHLKRNSLASCLRDPFFRPKKVSLKKHKNKHQQNELVKQLNQSYY